MNPTRSKSLFKNRLGIQSPVLTRMVHSPHSTHPSKWESSIVRDRFREFPVPELNISVLFSPFIESPAENFTNFDFQNRAQSCKSGITGKIESLPVKIFRLLTLKSTIKQFSVININSTVNIRVVALFCFSGYYFEYQQFQK